MSRIVMWPLLLVVLGWIFWGEHAAPWEPASFLHPLGTDEFGRDALSAMLLAVLVSAAKGTLLAVLSLLVGGAAAYAIAMHQSSTVSWLVAQATLVIESVPLMLWLLS